MIAVIEELANTVWGVGRDHAEAMAMAKKEISEYTGGEKITALISVSISNEADLDLSGDELYKFCKQTAKEVQQELF